MLIGDIICPLTEVRYEDIYPKAFVGFREKWLAVPREQWANLYVNFSNYSSDLLQKTAYRDPDHNDPVGVYGYPMDYVMDHPADVWYGQRAKYMRLLRSTASHVLDLQQSLTEDEALALLSKIEMKQYPYSWDNFPAQPREFLQLALERFKFRGPNRYTKAMFTVVQTKLQYNRKTDAFDGKLQTKRLRQMGFDAVLDTGQDEFSAVINSREPEQMIFLTRSAFEVIESLTLRADVDPSETVTFYNSEDSFRKLAARIAALIGDRLTTQFKDLLYMYYYTQHGRRIGLRADFRHMQRSSIKVHRGADTDTKEDVMVEIISERGKLERTYPSTWSFEQIATDVVERFNATSAGEGVTSRVLSQDRPEIAEAMRSWQALGQHYGVAWPADLGEKGMALVGAATQQIDRLLHSPWASNRRFKLQVVLEALRVFWSKQKSASLMAPMAAILTKLAKDRKIAPREMSSIAAIADVLA